MTIKNIQQAAVLSHTLETTCCTITHTLGEIAQDYKLVLKEPTTTQLNRAHNAVKKLGKKDRSKTLRARDRIRIYYKTIIGEEIS